MGYNSQRNKVFFEWCVVTRTLVESKLRKACDGGVVRSR